jgi:hypothetical protein
VTECQWAGAAEELCHMPRVGKRKSKEKAVTEDTGGEPAITDMRIENKILEVSPLHLPHNGATSGKGFFPAAALRSRPGEDLLTLRDTQASGRCLIILYSCVW